MKKIVIIIFIILIAILRLLFGEFNFHFQAPLSMPTFQVNFESNKIGSDIEMRKKITIIPFIFNIIQHDYLFTEGNRRITLNYDNELILDIKSYQCYSTVTGVERKTKCSTNNQNLVLKETERFNYNNLKITGGSTIGTSSTVVYNDHFNNDLKKIIKKKGIYTIIISVNDNNFEADIYLIVELI